MKSEMLRMLPMPKRGSVSSWVAVGAEHQCLLTKTCSFVDLGQCSLHNYRGHDKDMQFKKALFALVVSFYLAISGLTAAAQSIPSINFVLAKPQPASSFFNVTVGDVNGDGWLESFGGLNDTAGNLQLFPKSSMGLLDCLSPFVPANCLAINTTTGTRLPNDVRLADFNGDGCPDLIAQGYSSTSDDTRALLYFNDGTGRFKQDPLFASFNMRGKGEGVVVADFNNDGYVDIFLPYYTFTCNFPGDACPNAPQAYLFLNDGHGHFREVAKQAGLDFSPGSSVALYGMQQEGVQAADVNNDGLIDLYVGGHLMINTFIDANGIPHFKDLCGINPSCGLPDLTVLNTDQHPLPGHPDDLGERADEGFKFLDWNNDGLLDLVWLDWRYGPILFQNIGTATNPIFQAQAFTTDGLTRPADGKRRPFFSDGAPNYNLVPFQDSFQVNVYDLANDGREDIITAATAENEICRSPLDPNFLKAPCPQLNAVFRNTGVGYEKVAAGAISPANSDRTIGLPVAEGLAFADINRDGKIDVIYQVQGGLSYFQNTTSNSNSFVSIEMLGPNGEQNQFGRVVQVQPQGFDTPIYTRVVDGGSGERSQSQYALLVGTPVKYAGTPHLVKAFYPAPEGGTTVVSFTMNPGQYAQVFAPSTQYPGGHAVTYTPPRFPPPPVHGQCVPWASGTPSGTPFVAPWHSNGLAYLGTDGSVWWTWNNSSASTASGWHLTKMSS